MNYTQINLDLQSVVKRAYYNLLYRSSFMNWLSKYYIGDIRQTGTPMIEVIKQRVTPMNEAHNQPELLTKLDPALATYGSKLVDLAQLRLDYAFRVSYLMTESGIKQTIDGQIELQDSENARKIDIFGYNKFNTEIVGPEDGSLAYTKGQVKVWNPATAQAYIDEINRMKSKLFDRNIYENYLLGLKSEEYADFVSNLTTILKYETLAGVEGVDRGEVARAYGLSIFPINGNVLSSGVKGYFGHDVATIGDAFFTRFNEWNGSYPGYPGYYVVEGIILFGAEVVRPEALIKLVDSVVTLTAGSFDAGTVNTAYSQATAFSGTDVEKYIAIGLPAGLSIGETTGSITGTPTEAGTFAVKVYGIDANGNYSDAKEGNIVIS